MQVVNRVVKNTVILYARMAITVGFSLYSTRLILAALGAEDFGLFNLVGGAIAMLGFLNGSMAAATQRFISFSQGAGDFEKVKRIFNMSILLHTGVAILAVVLLEIVGYFFFSSVLNIPPNRIGVGKMLYHFIVASTFVSILAVPYEAVIIAHENMFFFAVISIVESILKLAIAISITYSLIDHLFLFGLLNAILTILLLIIRWLYCKKKYKECLINLKDNYDYNVLREISTFAAWSLLGVSSSMITNYGQGLVLNIFFGTLINAAIAIAGQLNGQISVFAFAFMRVVNPIIDKSEGAGTRANMLRTTMIASKMSFFILMVTTIPFYFLLPYILEVWLNKSIAFTILFCKLMIIRSLIEQLFIPLNSAIAAQGNIKQYNIINSILLIFPLLISYLLFKLGYPPYTLYVIFIFYTIVSSMFILYFAKKNCGLNIKKFIKDVIMRCVTTYLLIFCITYIPYFFINNNNLRLIGVVFTSLIMFFPMVYFWGLTKEERYLIKNISFKNKNQ